MAGLLPPSASSSAASASAASASASSIFDFGGNFPPYMQQQQGAYNGSYMNASQPHGVSSMSSSPHHQQQQQQMYMPTPWQGNSSSSVMPSSMNNNSMNNNNNNGMRPLSQSTPSSSPSYSAGLGLNSSAYSAPFDMSFFANQQNLLQSLQQSRLGHQQQYHHQQQQQQHQQQQHQQQQHQPSFPLNMQQMNTSNSHGAQPDYRSAASAATGGPSLFASSLFGSNNNSQLPQPVPFSSSGAQHQLVNYPNLVNNVAMANSSTQSAAYPSMQSPARGTPMPPQQWTSQQSPFMPKAAAMFNNPSVVAINSNNKRPTPMTPTSQQPIFHARSAFSSPLHRDEDSSPGNAPYRCIILCGVPRDKTELGKPVTFDPNVSEEEEDRMAAKRSYYMQSPFFNRDVDVFQAAGDNDGHVLVKAALLADKLGISHSALGMHLSRRKKQSSSGIYQAVGYRFKMQSRNAKGLKVGAYFITVEACIACLKYYGIRATGKDDLGQPFLRDADGTTINASSTADTDTDTGSPGASGAESSGAESNGTRGGPSPNSGASSNSSPALSPPAPSPPNSNPASSLTSPNDMTAPLPEPMAIST